MAPGAVPVYSGFIGGGAAWRLHSELTTAPFVQAPCAIAIRERSCLVVGNMYKLAHYSFIAKGDRMLAKHHAMVTILILSASGLFGCSPVMEATRPNPVDIGQLAVGESRAEAEAELGPPVCTITDRGKSCDIYKLYTHGLNGVEKGAIAVGEAAADVFTLGLAEVVLIHRSCDPERTLCGDALLRKRFLRRAPQNGS